MPSCKIRVPRILAMLGLTLGLAAAPPEWQDERQLHAGTEAPAAGRALFADPAAALADRISNGFRSLGSRIHTAVFARKRQLPVPVYA